MCDVEQVAEAYAKMEAALAAINATDGVSREALQNNYEGKARALTPAGRKTLRRGQATREKQEIDALIHAVRFILILFL
jgi:hypothetical protein